MNPSANRINRLSHSIGASRYLEIGVSRGETFCDVVVDERTGVDPNFQFDIHEAANKSTILVPTTSDSFFASVPLFPPYDIIFIDGLHIFEQVVRDFSNALLRTHCRSLASG